MYTDACFPSEASTTAAAPYPVLVPVELTDYPQLNLTVAALHVISQWENEMGKSLALLNAAMLIQALHNTDEENARQVNIDGVLVPVGALNVEVLALLRT